MATDKIEQLITQLDSLTLLEAAELSKRLQEKWGVTAAAPMAVGMPVGAGAPGAAAATGDGAAAPAEEKTEFDVVLKEIGPEKIKVIKAVRELTNLGLKEAKEAVEGAPTPIKTGVSKDEANAAATKLKEAGAVVDIR